MLNKNMKATFHSNGGDTDCLAICARIFQEDRKATCNFYNIQGLLTTRVNKSNKNNGLAKKNGKNQKISCRNFHRNFHR